MNSLEKLQTIEDDGEELTPWEIEFVGGLVDGDRVQFSARQIAIIDKIYDERVPR